jgi:hypothetical protein
VDTRGEKIAQGGEGVMEWWSVGVVGAERDRGVVRSCVTDVRARGADGAAYRPLPNPHTG